MSLFDFTGHGDGPADETVGSVADLANGSALLSNPAGRDLAWEAVKTHWAGLKAGLAAFGGVGRIVEGLGAFCSVADARGIRQFFADHPVPDADRTLRQTLERIESCAALAAAQQPQLAAWLARSAMRSR